MKFFKIFTIAIAALSFTACSDDDPTWNTESDVTVEMGKAAYTTKEGRGIVTVPISVTGERNGNIEVALAVKADYPNAAQEDVHFYFTTKAIVIAPEFDTYNVEITIIDDAELNEDRIFDVYLESAEGAKIGTQNFTQITIEDNDSNPYDRVSGEWVLDYINPASGSTELLKASVKLVAQENTERYLILTGVPTSFPDMQFMVNFFYDETTEEGHLEMNYDQTGGSTEIGSYGDCPIWLYTPAGSNSFTGEGGTIMYWNEDFTELSIEDRDVVGEYPYWWFLFEVSGQGYGNIEQMVPVKMTRP